MEIIIGVTRDSQSLDSVALGMLIADAIDATPVIANVYQLAFDYPGPARVDAEWHGFLIEQAHETLDGARANIGDRDGVEYCLLGHRSSGKGLAQLAIDRRASMIVIGSNNDASDGRIGSGSTANQLLHGSPVPVAIAPRGYSTWAPKRLGHIVFAYQRSSESDHAFNVIRDTLLAHPVHGSLGLNLVTIIERVTKIYGSRLGRSAEQGVLAALREQALDGLRIAQARIPAARFNAARCDRSQGSRELARRLPWERGGPGIRTLGWGLPNNGFQDRLLWPLGQPSRWRLHMVERPG